MLLLWYVVMFMFNNNFPGSNVFEVVRSDVHVVLFIRVPNVCGFVQ